MPQLNRDFKSPTDYIRSHQQEAVKQYIVYDGSNRMIETYVAHFYATTGDQCLKTTYTYWGASTRIKLMKEELSTWDEAWEA